MSDIFLETQRLILRNWRQSDHEPFISLNADSEVMEYFPAVKTREETIAQIGRIQAHIGKFGYGFFAVERKDNQQFIGFTGLTNAPFESFFTPCVEIGWRFARSAWGHGFASEAATACLQDGFDRLGVDEIYSFTAVDNLRSEKVMIRIGMEHVGEFDHPNMAKGHALERHVLYRIGRP